MIWVFINGDICNFVSEANGRRDIIGIIINYIRDCFNIKPNFFIFLQNYIASISEWFICYEWSHGLPEFDIPEYNRPDLSRPRIIKIRPNSYKMVKADRGTQ